jgi:hypothetical protein
LRLSTTIVLRQDGDASAPEDGYLDSSRSMIPTRSVGRRVVALHSSGAPAAHSAATIASALPLVARYRAPEPRVEVRVSAPVQY